jgi:hypothetical protein
VRQQLPVRRPRGGDGRARRHPCGPRERADEVRQVTKSPRRTGAPALWRYQAERKSSAGCTHIGFTASDRAGRRALSRGGTRGWRAQHGKSGVRADNGPNYYAAFLLDPDGNNVESLWLR